MKKTRAVIFNLIFQLTLAILILDFQTNPQYLRSECITGTNVIISPCIIRNTRNWSNY